MNIEMFDFEWKSTFKTKTIF